ncbi:hypothetical protein ABFY09_01815 [Marinomonas sp. 5E14-1]
MRPAPNNAPEWMLASLQERHQQDLMRRPFVLDNPQRPNARING